MKIGTLQQKGIGNLQSPVLVYIYTEISPRNLGQLLHIVCFAGWISLGHVQQDTKEYLDHRGT